MPTCALKRQNTPKVLNKLILLRVHQIAYTAGVPKKLPEGAPNFVHRWSTPSGAPSSSPKEGISTGRRRGRTTSAGSGRRRTDRRRRASTGSDDAAGRSSSTLPTTVAGGFGLSARGQLAVGRRADGGVGRAGSGGCAADRLTDDESRLPVVFFRRLRDGFFSDLKTEGADAADLKTKGVVDGSRSGEEGLGRRLADGRRMAIGEMLQQIG
ncbi:hypothetical protein ACLOJK_027301 [Asimina triloba]